MSEHQYEPWMDDVEAAGDIAPEPKASAATEEHLLKGLGRPIRIGWSLWAHSLKPLVGHLWPVALLLALGLLLAAPGFMETLGEEETLVDSGVEEEAPGAEGLPGELSLFQPEDPFGQIPWPALVVQVVLLAFGFALTGVVLSQRHTGRAPEIPYFLTLRRILPWAATEFLVLGILLGVSFFGLPVLRLSFLGGLLALMASLVLAVFLSLRLFWADEFALIHGSGPLRALKQSWRLTHNAARQILNFQFLLGLLAYPVFLVALVVFFLLGLPLGVLENLGAGWLADLGLLTLGFLMLFLTYGVIHAPELAYFYGVRAARSDLQPSEIAGAGWLEAAKKRAIEPA